VSESQLGEMNIQMLVLHVEAVQYIFII